MELKKPFQFLCVDILITFRPNANADKLATQLFISVICTIKKAFNRLVKYILNNTNLFELYCSLLFLIQIYKEIESKENQVYDIL